MNTTHDAEHEASLKRFATEISTLEKKAFEKGRASASSLEPEVATAERMAERARQLQAITPSLSNVQATKMAYKEAGIELE